MTRPRIGILASIGLALTLAAGPAAAQLPYTRPQTSPFNRPAISPYINMFRPGGNIAQNYFGLVRPEIQFNQDVNQLQNRQALLGAQIAAGTESQAVLPPTGHATGFQTQYRYFQTQFRGGAGLASYGGPQGARGGAQQSGGAGAARPPARR
jgi:hypothetical protein